MQEKMNLRQEKVIVKMIAEQERIKAIGEALLEMSDASVKKKPAPNEMANLATHPEDSNIAEHEETIGATEDRSRTDAWQ
jgi:hypothetical protein